jgi:endonuclease III-like uncharacterized protein
LLKEVVVVDTYTKKTQQQLLAERAQVEDGTKALFAFFF